MTKLKYRKKLVAAFLVSGALTAVLLWTVAFDFSSQWVGLYLLRGTEGKLLEVKNDILLGEYERLITKIDFLTFGSKMRLKARRKIDKPFYEKEWSAEDGSGFVKSYFQDRTRLIICLSRFEDSEGKTPRGVFLGGGLPYSDYEEEGNVNNNETGMAFFDGNRWFHIWCNANESIAGSSARQVYPSSWEFLGSRVVYNRDGELIIESDHRVNLDGVPFRIDRFFLYRAGDRHFTLVIRIRNDGTVPASYYYVYGDEPWLGDFGTSVGNIGWTKDGPVHFEGPLDPREHDFAGMHDVGNPYVVGSSATYSGMANFLDWSQGVRPELAYFSNRIGNFASSHEKVPLYDKQNRVIMLQWGPRMLRPGESERIVLAIGMAATNTGNPMPMKPETKTDGNLLDFLLETEP